jgi:hypothetical protein
VDKRTIAEAKRRMLEATEYAEKLQDLYNEQRDELVGKRIVMVSRNGEAVIDSDFCAHLRVDDGHCLDCGMFWRDDGTWGPEHLPTDEYAETYDAWEEL